MKLRNNKAFTVLELVIVIAILAAALSEKIRRKHQKRASQRLFFIRRVDDLTIVIIASFQVIVNRCSQNNFEIVAIMNKTSSKTFILSVFGVVLRGYSASFSPFFRRVVYSTNHSQGRRKTNQKRRKTCTETTKRASLS